MRVCHDFGAVSLNVGSETFPRIYKIEPFNVRETVQMLSSKNLHVEFVKSTAMGLVNSFIGSVKSQDWLMPVSFSSSFSLIEPTSWRDAWHLALE
jgi:hypothetical protein